MNIPAEKARTIETHAQHLQELATVQPDVILLGDSLFERLTFAEEPEIIEKYRQLKERKVFIAGVGGDGIQHMLWRVGNRLFDSEHCENLRTVVVMAGTNNMENAKTTPTAIFEAYVKLVSMIPTLKKIIFNLPPRTTTKPVKYDIMAKVREYNELLKNYAEQNNYRYVDVFSRYVDASGQRREELFCDHVHFSQQGMQIMFEIIDEVLAE